MTSDDSVQVQTHAVQQNTQQTTVDHDTKSGDDRFSSILKVKADPKNISADERKKRVKNLAGAIAHGLRQYGEVTVRCFGSACIAKAVKAMAIARGFVAVQGYDLYFAPAFITADMEGEERTGISFLCVTSKSDTVQD